MSIHKDAVKEGTFLADYLSYMSPLETPLAYDFWTGLWLISTAVGRNIVVNRPHAPVFLNLYVVLCADAGSTRKSTAVRRCEAVYSAARLSEYGHPITGSITPERLTEQLALQSTEHGNSAANIIISELVQFLGREQYAIAMPGLLTDLYDAPSIRTISRVGSGNHTIRNTYVTFLAASTPSWLIRAINPDVIEGGFTSRCLFIIAEKRKRLVAWPNGDTSFGLDTCSKSLLHLREKALYWGRKGISLTDNALTRFITWYEKRANASFSDPFRASFDAREDHHILRLAALLACNDLSFTIDVHHLNHAIKIIALHRDEAAALFSASKESTRLVAGIDKLRSVLMQAGELGIGQSELLFKTRATLKTRELEYALNIMHEMEMVQRFEVSTGGRKKTVWRGTNKLLLRNLNTLLGERMLTE